MIPKFDKSGYLPPGKPYKATWEEFQSRFGGSEQRNYLLKGLKEALINLKEAGCARAYIDGSFVSSKEHPNDWDACWDMKGVDFDLIDSVIIDADFFPDHMKEKYLGDLFPQNSKLPGGNFLEFFQSDRNGVRKGLVVINLETIL